MSSIQSKPSFRTFVRDQVQNPEAARLFAAGQSKLKSTKEMWAKDPSKAAIEWASGCQLMRDGLRQAMSLPNFTEVKGRVLAKIDKSNKAPPEIAAVNKGLIQSLSEEATLLAQPTTMDGFVARARLLQSTGNFAAALADYNSAIKMAPDLADLYYRRGTLYDQTGARDSARADYTRAIEKRPDLWQAYRSRSNILADRGDLVGAAKDCGSVHDICMALSRLPENAQYAPQLREIAASASARQNELLGLEIIEINGVRIANITLE